jgi:hypothetical protein
VRTGRVELPWPCGRWNLNPVRLPVPPRSHKQDCSHYIVRSLIPRQPPCAATLRFECASRCTPKRADFRPHGHGDASIMSCVRRSPGPSMCRPSCASHSPANNCPDGPMICSKTGTRKARQNALRSSSVSRCQPGRSNMTSACVKEGIRNPHNRRHCSTVAATADGSKRAASSAHPWGNIRTGCEGSSGGRNQDTRTAVRGAGGTG